MSDLAAPPDISLAQWRKFALAAAVLALAFAVPLWRLFRFAITDDLYSYIPLMPAVSVYLAWILKPELPRHSPPARKLAGLWFAAGAAALAGYWMLARAAAVPNALALSTLAWLLALTGAGCWLLGGAMMRSLIFPFGLLWLMIPLPVFLRTDIETVLQHGSAMAADWMFVLAGTPVRRTDLVFDLPGFSLEVAPECSGIHSSWVLLITSLVAGRMILRRPGNRVILCLAVVPLALLRNGFRVFVIGELCVHVGPQMIDSPIHRRGGPLFFILSLVPFFLLLYFLRKRETRRVAAPASKSEK